MSLAYAEVSHDELMGLHPDKAAGVDPHLVHRAMRDNVNRDIFGQLDGEALKGVYDGLEHSANTELLRNIADATRPKTDALAGVLVDSAAGAIGSAHEGLAKGLDRIAAIGEELPAGVAATVAAAGALLAGSFKAETPENGVSAGDVGYDVALDLDGDGHLNPQEQKPRGPDGIELNNMHLGVVVADMTQGAFDANDIALSSDPAQNVAYARKFMEAKAQQSGLTV